MVTDVPIEHGVQLVRVDLELGRDHPRSRPAHA
jgi:hypothetical protein